MRRLMITSAIAIGLVAAQPGAAQDDAETGEIALNDPATVLASVNGTDITLGHMIVALTSIPAEYQQLPDEFLFGAMLDQLIDQVVLQHSLPDPDPSLRIRLFVENTQREMQAGDAIDLLLADAVTEEALMALYTDTIASIEPAPEFNASHILVETEDAAAALVAALAEGADFADLARENSVGPSGPNGGELGWFGMGMMVAEFESAVAGMEAGDIAGPVQTQFGWHVIRMNDTRIRPVPSLDELRPRLAQQLQQQAVEAGLAALREFAEIVMPETDVLPAAIRDFSAIIR